ARTRSSARRRTRTRGRGRPAHSAGAAPAERARRDLRSCSQDASGLVVAPLRRILHVFPLHLVEANRARRASDVALLLGALGLVERRGLVQRPELDLVVLGRGAQGRLLVRLRGVLVGFLPPRGRRRQLRHLHDVVAAAQVAQLLAQLLRLATLVLQAL